MAIIFLRSPLLKRAESLPTVGGGVGGFDKSKPYNHPDPDYAPPEGKGTELAPPKLGAWNPKAMERLYRLLDVFVKGFERKTPEAWDAFSKSLDRAFYGTRWQSGSYTGGFDAPASDVHDVISYSHPQHGTITIDDRGRWKHEKDGETLAEGTPYGFRALQPYVQRLGSVKVGCDCKGWTDSPKDSSICTCGHQWHEHLHSSDFGCKKEKKAGVQSPSSDFVPGENILWAIWRGKPLTIIEGNYHLGGPLWHVRWFEKLNKGPFKNDPIPVSGPNFDRVPRGRAQIDPGRNTVHLYTDARDPSSRFIVDTVAGINDFEFVPDSVVAKIKQEFPPLKDYEFVDEINTPKSKLNQNDLPRDKAAAAKKAVSEMPVKIMDGEPDNPLLKKKGAFGDDFLENLKEGGPGLSGYIFRSSTYCPDHGQDIIDDLVLTKQIGPPAPREEASWMQDSDILPQPVFFMKSGTETCAERGEDLSPTPEVQEKSMHSVGVPQFSKEDEDWMRDMKIFGSKNGMKNPLLKQQPPDPETATFLKESDPKKPHCPHCGSDDYDLMPTDFETAKCKRCGKNWNHGIVKGINDPSDSKTAAAPGPEGFPPPQRELDYSGWSTVANLKKYMTELYNAWLNKEITREEYEAENYLMNIAREAAMAAQATDPKYRELANAIDLTEGRYDTDFMKSMGITASKTATTKSFGQGTPVGGTTGAPAPTSDAAKDMDPLSQQQGWKAPQPPQANTAPTQTNPQMNEQVAKSVVEQLEEKLSGLESKVDIHESTDMLPPRTELRKHIDESQIDDSGAPPIPLHKGAGFRLTAAEKASFGADASAWWTSTPATKRRELAGKMGIEKYWSHFTWDSLPPEIQEQVNQNLPEAVSPLELTDEDKEFLSGMNIRAAAKNWDPLLAKSLFDEGTDAMEHGRVEEATDALRKSLLHNPYNGPAHFMLGIILAQEGDGQASLGELQKALRANPKENYAYHSIIKRLGGEGDLDGLPQEVKDFLKDQMVKEEPPTWTHEASVKTAIQTEEGVNRVCPNCKEQKSKPVEDGIEDTSLVECLNCGAFYSK